MKYFPANAICDVAFYNKHFDGSTATVKAKPE